MFSPQNVLAENHLHTDELDVFPYCENQLKLTNWMCSAENHLHSDELDVSAPI